MEVKEATKFVETEKRIICGCATQCLEAKGFDDVISLLKQGERYGAMWQTLLEDLDFRPNKEKLHMNWEDFNNLMVKIEQKYSPKEAKQNYPESEE